VQLFGRNTCITTLNNIIQEKGIKEFALSFYIFINLFITHSKLHANETKDEGVKIIASLKEEFKGEYLKPVAMPSEFSKKAEEIQNKIRIATDLYYTNNFEKSSEILKNAWEEILTLNETMPVPENLMRESFVFLMLTLKVLNKKEEAKKVGVKGATLIEFSSIEKSDIPPDGLEFIRGMMQGDYQESKKFHLNVKIKKPLNNCELLVDGSGKNINESLILLSPGLHHWVGLKCDNLTGWLWKIKGENGEEKTLYMFPEYESFCNISNFPTIECSKYEEEAILIGLNLLNYPEVEKVQIEKGGMKNNKRGIYVLEIDKNSSYKKSDISWRWEGTFDVETEYKKQKTKYDRKKTFIPVVFTSLAISLAGVSTGLGLWWNSIRDDRYEIKDPWERDRNEQKSERVFYGAISTSAISVILGTTALALWIDAIKRKKEVKKEKLMELEKMEKLGFLWF